MYYDKDKHGYVLEPDEVAGINAKLNEINALCEVIQFYQQWTPAMPHKCVKS